MTRRREEWDDLAVLDPAWGVITIPELKHSGGEPTEAFWASGGANVEELVTQASRLELPQRRQLALDFGCGLGRLTRSLAERFSETVGVDVSPSLVERARDLNAHVTNCKFQVLDEGGLQEFASNSVDFVCSLIVLQHQSNRREVGAYIREFVRVIRPDGIAAFQIPTHIPLRNRVQPRRRVYAALKILGVPRATLYSRFNLDPIRMIHLPPLVVAAEVTRGGGSIAAAVPDHLGGAFPSTTYYVTKRR